MADMFDFTSDFNFKTPIGNASGDDGILIAGAVGAALIGIGSFFLGRFSNAVSKDDLEEMEKRMEEKFQKKEGQEEEPKKKAEEPATEEAKTEETKQEEKPQQTQQENQQQTAQAVA